MTIDAIGIINCIENMMNREEVNSRFGYTRPDTIARHWPGVSDVPGLRDALLICVPHYGMPMSHQEIVEHGYDQDSVARFWDRLSTEHQLALIHLDAGWDY